MIHAIYLNPTIDKTVYVKNLAPGGTNRVERLLLQAGGKGLNVAIGLTSLGQAASLIGFVYQGNASFIHEATKVHSIATHFLEYPGYCRTNTKIFDAGKEEVTELNETGPSVTKDMLEALETTLLKQVSKEDVVILTGSLPPGCKDDYYAHLMGRLPCPCAVDAEGNALTRCLPLHPLLIKPNLHELELLLGRKLEGKADLKASACQIAKDGNTIVAVSLGNKGALITDGNSTYQALPLSLSVDSTVGAGDSMLAGLLSVLSQGGNIQDALAMGSAMASASVILPGTSLATREQAEAFLPRISIQQI